MTSIISIFLLLLGISYSYQQKTDSCEFSSDNVNGGKDLTSSGCKPNNDTKVDCSGRGTCVCGKCECASRQYPEESITGPYCECDNFSCDRYNGLVCSGPDHGKCECGKCLCLNGWYGSACECSTSIESCITSAGNEICSGNGICECGKCLCLSGWTGNACECSTSIESCKPPSSGNDEICSGKGNCECGVCKCQETFHGPYCERCRTCPNRCLEYKECVQCSMYKSEDNCSQNCSKLQIIPVKTTEANEEKDEYLCTFYDDDDCKFSYVYAYDKFDNVTIRAEENRDCPSQA